jgi:hypothetical protein
MTFGTVGMAHPSLAAMVDAIRAKMSREGLHLRFTASAVSFMQRCVEFVLKQRVNAMTVIDSHLLNHFKRIKIFDSTSWDIDPLLRDVLPGCGGDASSANCKVQLCYEYLRGALSFFEILPGKKPDSGYAKMLPEHTARGDLLIADLGYFCLETLMKIINCGAFFVLRFLIGTTLYDAMTMQEIDLRCILQKVTGAAYQMSVIMGSKEQTRVSCRLICLRVDEKIAEERRRKLRQNAAKKGRTVSELHLYMAGWILMVTNVPCEWLPPEMVRPLYGLRWQIELLFKQLKSVLAIHRSDTGKEPRLRCEILGKLIVAILIHRIHADANIDLWNTTGQEISMDKLYKRIQERAFIFMGLLCTSLQKALSFLSEELSLLMKNCRKLNQKSRPTTLQMLDRNISLCQSVESIDMSALT